MKKIRIYWSQNDSVHFVVCFILWWIHEDLWMRPGLKKIGSINATANFTSNAVILRFRATVCKTVRPMLSDSCLSVCLVTLVYFRQTVGWIDMPLGTHVVLGPGHIVLDGNPAPTPRKRTQQPPLFGPRLLWPNGRPSQQLLSSCCWYDGFHKRQQNVIKKINVTV